MMKQMKQRYIKNLVSFGKALNVTSAHNRSVIEEPYSVVGFSSGKYGLNGLLMRGESGRLYAVTDRSPACFFF